MYYLRSQAKTLFLLGIAERRLYFDGSNNSREGVPEAQILRLIKNAKMIAMSNNFTVYRGCCLIRFNRM
jgi:hypothetical protein